MNKQYQQAFAHVFYMIGSTIMILDGVLVGNNMMCVGGIFFLLGTMIMPLFGDER